MICFDQREVSRARAIMRAKISEAMAEKCRQKYCNEAAEKRREASTCNHKPEIGVMTAAAHGFRVKPARTSSSSLLAGPRYPRAISPPFTTIRTNLTNLDGS